MSDAPTNDTGAPAAVADRTLLSVTGLKKYFQLPAKIPIFGRPSVVPAVDDVTFAVAEGATVSVVGESGSGKTTLSRVILGLEKPTAGTIVFEGVDITRRRSWRGRSAPIQAVFQSPWSSLDPRMRVDAILAEPMQVGGMTPEAISERIDELLDFVGISRTARRRFPHEFSGGQRQRVAIARALSVRPKLIILDEPVSSLDVSIRAQIINLLADIQAEIQTSYLMIAHDLATVRFLSDVVLVMYLGAIVEQAPVDSLFENPRHPYSQALLSASLPLTPDAPRKRMRISGEISTAAALEGGCRFRSRCPFAFDRCVKESPPLKPTGVAGHLAACHLVE